MSRYEQLGLARLIDWRFLLPSPELGRVACVDPIGSDHLAAIGAVAAHVEAGSAMDLRRGSWDVVVAPRSIAAHGNAAVADALELLEPGGWLLLDLPHHARMRGQLSRLTASLVDRGAELVRARWYMPDLARSSIVVPLEDPQAVRAALARRRSTRTKSALVRGARWLTCAGVPPDVLAGEVRLLARRRGGAAAGRLPSLEPVADVLEPFVGTDPSWTLLTPRFAASAHVILLLRSAGTLQLVAKIARLASDDGPEREGRMLESLVRAGVPGGALPRPVFVGRTGGHAVLVEEGLEGSLLDRRTVRGDPGRWIGAAARWLRALPRLDQEATGRATPIVPAALDVIRTTWPDPDTAALVVRSTSLLAAVDEGLPKVTEHGDLGHPNIVVRPDGDIAVLDWELARPDGLPLHDLCTFLDYVAIAAFGDEVGAFDAFCRLLRHPSWGAAATFREEADALGVAPELRPALVTSCWVRMFAGLTSRLFAGGTRPPEGSHRRNRYYQLWERSVREQDRLRSLLG